MVRQRSWGIVVDASIARAAGGEDAVFPQSKHCRDFLRDMLEICHKIVMTEQIYEEWKEHESNFARLWRIGMIARRKLVNLGDVSEVEINNEIDDLAVSQNNRAAMKKDALLITAALSADGLVASSDDAVRKLYSQACEKIARLRPVIWVNPANDYEAVSQWMRRGAKNSRGLRLKDFRAGP